MSEPTENGTGNVLGRFLLLNDKLGAKSVHSLWKYKDLLYVIIIIMGSVQKLTSILLCLILVH